MGHSRHVGYSRRAGRTPFCNGLTSLTLVIGAVLAGCSSDDASSSPTASTAPATTTAIATVAVTETATTEPATTETATTEPATTEPATSVAAGPKKLPPVSIAPGTYLVDKFVAPFTFGVTNKWTTYGTTDKFIWITRVGVVKSEFLVTTLGVIAGTTPQEAVDGFCPASAAVDSTDSATTLFGGAAVQREFVSTQDCSSPGHVGNDSNNWYVPAGNTIRLVSAQVGPNLISVIADAPTDQWATFSPEIDTMIASFAPAG